MKAHGSGILEEIRDAMKNIVFESTTKNDIVEELTRAYVFLTDTVRSLQGYNNKLITMLVLCHPTNSGGIGYYRTDWDSEGYCWLYVFTVFLDHNSGNCGSSQAVN